LRFQRALFKVGDEGGQLLELHLKGRSDHFFQYSMANVTSNCNEGVIYYCVTSTQTHDNKIKAVYPVAFCIVIKMVESAGNIKGPISQF